MNASSPNNNPITKPRPRPCVQLTAVLQHVDDWQFNSFDLPKATGGRPLSALAFYLFKRSDIPSRFGMDEQKLAR